MKICTMQCLQDWLTEEASATVFCYVDMYLSYFTERIQDKSAVSHCEVQLSDLGSITLKAINQ